jgi:DNA-binding PadR family transcriptional regulator
MKRKDRAEALGPQRFAEQSTIRWRSPARLEAVKRGVRRRRRLELTTPDLVLLSLLAERPMHGYQANLELERREIRDWAGISRPQIYYSLEKLAGRGLIRTSETDEPAAGPERSTYSTAAKGRAALADALEREEWATQRERPPFLTWVALSWQARRGIFEKQIERRRRFLEKELAREKETLKSILEEVGHPYHEAVWVVSFVVEQFKLELRWLRKLKRELPRRARALKPAYTGSEST